MEKRIPMLKMEGVSKLFPIRRKKERKKKSCVLGLSVADNIILSNLKKYENKWKSIDKNKEIQTYK